MRAAITVNLRNGTSQGAGVNRVASDTERVDAPSLTLRGSHGIL